MWRTVVTANEPVMSEVNWRRVVATSAIVMALLLVCGSIYLHVQQKHHLGRIQHPHHVPTRGITEDPVSVAALSSSAELEDFVLQTPPLHISEVCLQCICETITECRPATCGDNLACGIFRISQPYWLDAGKPALQGDNATEADNNMRYSHCVNNAYCAARAVSAFVLRYSRDCNQDGKIDCRDHVALHILGPSGCMENEMMPVFESRMEDCLSSFS